MSLVRGSRRFIAYLGVTRNHPLRNQSWRGSRCSPCLPNFDFILSNARANIGRNNGPSKRMHFHLNTQVKELSRTGIPDGSTEYTLRLEISSSVDHPIALVWRTNGTNLGKRKAVTRPRAETNGSPTWGWKCGYGLFDRFCLISATYAVYAAEFQYLRRTKHYTQCCPHSEFNLCAARVD